MKTNNNSTFDIFKKVFRPGKYFVLSSLSDRILSFIIFLIIARIFSADQYGEVVSITTLTNIFAVIFDLGLPIYLQRETAKNSDYRTLINLSLSIKIICFSIYLLFLFIYSNLFLSQINNYFILMLAVSAYLNGISSLFNYLLYGKNKIKIVFLVNLIAKIVLLILTVMLVFLNYSIYCFIFFYLSSNLLQLLLLWIYLNRMNIKPELKIPGFLEVKKILAITIPLGLAVVVNLLYDRIDILFVNNFLGTDKVAQYNVAYTTYKSVIIIFGLFYISGFNMLTGENHLTVMSKLSVAVFFSGLILTIFLFLFGNEAIKYLFGVKYSEGALLTKLLSLVIIGVGMNGLTGVYLNAQGLFKKVLLATAIGLIINIGFNIYLIPRFGIKGAAYSTIITEYVILAVESFFIFKIYFSQRTNKVSYGNI